MALQQQEQEEEIMANWLSLDLSEVTREQFIAWAETKPEDKPSCIDNTHICPMAEYAMEELGFTTPDATVIFVRDLYTSKRLVLKDFSFSYFSGAKTYGEVVKALRRRE